MPVFHVPTGIQLQLKSPTGEVLAYISDNEEQANKLQVKMLENIFGLDEMSITIPRTLDLPITRNSEVALFADGVAKYIGIVQENPTLDQSKSEIELKLKGLVHELHRKIINTSYAAQTLEYIVKNLGSTFLGSAINILYDVAKITVPVIANITIEFKDVSLFDAFETCMQIANYSLTYYRFYVDLEKEFVFAPFDTAIKGHLFEGYHFQNPEVFIETSKMVNRVLTYRTTLANPDVTEFVAAYDDTASQSKYGLFEKKITFSNYIDTTTIQKIATFILNKRANPLEKVSVNELMPFIPFGKYRVSNKPNRFWKLITDCNLLGEWDLTHITDTVVTLSSVRVLTGRQSIRADTGLGSENEYIEFTLIKEIALPQFFRIFVYYVSVVDLIRITFYDNDGNNEILNLPQVNKELTTSDGLLEANGIQVVVDFITETVADTWLRLSTPTVLKNLKKIRVAFLTNEALTVYFDRLDVFGYFYTMYELWLEEQEIELTSKSKKCSLHFGDPAESFAGEVDDKVEEGNIALAIFSKQ